MKKAIAAIVKGIEWILEKMILIAVLFIFLQVLFRYVFKHPLIWTEQVTRFMFIWMMLLAFPVLFYDKNFMAFDTLLNLFPYRVRSIITILTKLCICGFCVYWFYGAAWLISGTYQKLTSGVRIPYYCLYGAQNVASLFSFVVMLMQAIEDIRSLAANWKTKGELIE